MIDHTQEVSELDPRGVEAAARERKPGVVETLCKEIGFQFDRRLERSEVLVAFVHELLSEVRFQRDMADHLGRMGGAEPSDGSAFVLWAAGGMFLADTDAERIKRAEAVHDACWHLNPDDKYPTDHLIDMVSSCASAIRFGLETPARSRHAAEAANHIWKQIYGVSRFDSATPAWEKDWARQRLISALITMALAEKQNTPGGDHE